MRMVKIVSGGQSGVDRAALDAAMEAGIAIGGWCPAGRRAEDGVIPAIYPMTETPKSTYAQRTEWNVRDSDATLILNIGALDGGTLRTRRYAEVIWQRPCLVIQMDETATPEEILEWLVRHSPRVLNVAGPRESKRPGVYVMARNLLAQALSAVAQQG